MSDKRMPVVFSGHGSPMLALEDTERDLETEFLSCAAEFPIVLLTGMHQCGKSTMIAHITKDGREVQRIPGVAVRDAAVSP